MKKWLGLLCLAASANVTAAGNDQHVLGVFVGATHNDSSDFTFGVEYEFKFTPQWGAGVVYERTNDAHYGDGASVIVANVFYHPDNHWRLGVGAGTEKIGGAYDHSETLWRLSAAYDFHLGGFGIAPTIAVDFVDGETLTVYGLTFVKTF